MFRGWLAVSSEGEQILVWNRMRVPHDLTGLQMPPEVGIVEAVGDGADSDECQSESQHRAERKHDAGQPGQSSNRRFGIRQVHYFDCGSGRELHFLELCNRQPILISI